MSQHTQHVGPRQEPDRQVRFVRESLWRRPQGGTRERMPRGR